MMSRPSELRNRFRSGAVSGLTAGMAPGWQQANIAIVPKQHADDFEGFLRANPEACPLLARGRAGDPFLPELGAGIDLRRDLPKYRVSYHGHIAAEPSDITCFWRDDLVAFAIGCSLSFESALAAEGVALRSHAPGASCAAFDSTLPAVATGPFATKLVLTMRAVPHKDLAKVISITSRYPQAHGAPIHVGTPEEIGVDLASPIDGIGVTDIRTDEVPVFWACGVTMERALARASLDLAITHAPGHMLITDLPVEAEPWPAGKESQQCSG